MKHGSKCSIAKATKHLASLFSLLIFFSILPHSAWGQADTLRIGATLPLTGRLAHAGEDIRRGLELAVSDFSQKKLQYEVLYEDNQHEPKQAAVTANRLVKINQVDLIVSLWDMADVVAPIAEQAQIPHIAIRWDPDITKQYEFTFTHENTYRTYIDSLIKMLIDFDFRKVSLITEEAQGWILGSQYFEQAAAQHAIDIASSEFFPQHESNFRTIIARALQNKPDIVVILSNPPYTQILLRRLGEMAPNQAVTGYLEIIEEKNLIEGIPFVSLFEAEDWFKEKFYKRYHENFKIRAPQAYDIVLLLDKAHQGYTTKLTGPKLLNALKSITDFRGASGHSQINVTRNIQSSCVLSLVFGGKLLTIR